MAWERVVARRKVLVRFQVKGRMKSMGKKHIGTFKIDAITHTHILIQLNSCYSRASLEATISRSTYISKANINKPKGRNRQDYKVGYFNTHLING